MDNSVDGYAIAVNYIKNQFEQPENQLPKDTADQSSRQVIFLTEGGKTGKISKRLKY
jgi:hypothetical protein